MFSGYLSDQGVIYISESDYHDAKIISKYLCMCNGPGLDFFSEISMQKRPEDNLFICISSDKYGLV